MTKKDYEVLAETIKRHRDHIPTQDRPQFTEFVLDLADKLAETNDNFDNFQFFRACGY